MMFMQVLPHGGHTDEKTHSILEKALRIEESWNRIQYSLIQTLKALLWNLGEPGELKTVKYCPILTDIILSCPRAHIHIPLWHQWMLSNSLFAGPCGNTVSELFWVKISFFFCRAIFNQEQLIGLTRPHENSCAGTTVG